MYIIDFHGHFEGFPEIKGPRSYPFSIKIHPFQLEYARLLN